MSFEQLIMNIDNPETVKELIDEGVNIHEENERALSSAVLFGETETVRILLENGADPIKAEENLLKIAREEGHDEIVALLLEYYADEPSEQLEEKIQISRDVLIENPINFVGKSRIEIAREIEAQNQRKRDRALLEYKNNSVSSKPKTWVENQCINEMNVFGDNLSSDERGEIVIFFFGDNEGKGECLTEKEIDKILESNSSVGVWEGFPVDSNVDLNGNSPGRKIEGTFLYKLPWSGNWITKEALEKGKEKLEEFIVLRGEKHSIGSVGRSISSLHGQWGGKYGYELDDNGKKIAYYSRSGNFQPDERYIVWDL